MIFWNCFGLYRADDGEQFVDVVAAIFYHMIFGWWWWTVYAEWIWYISVYFFFCVTYYELIWTYLRMIMIYHYIFWSYMCIIWFWFCLSKSLLGWFNAWYYNLLWCFDSESLCTLLRMDFSVPSNECKEIYDFFLWKKTSLVEMEFD